MKSLDAKLGVWECVKVQWGSDPTTLRSMVRHLGTQTTVEGNQRDGTPWDRGRPDARRRRAQADRSTTKSVVDIPLSPCLLRTCHGDPEQFAKTRRAMCTKMRDTS